jgi:hypothetical protein
MAFTLVQSGETLYSVNTDGGWTALVLPAGIILSALRVPRFERFKRYVILVNTPSRPLSIDVFGVVRVLTPLTPGSAIVLSNANGGTLSGTFEAVETFRILDALGNVISESDYSPVSNSETITTDYLNATNVLVSTDDITDRQLYRTTDNGAVFFPWIVIDGNIITSINDDTPDSGLGIVSAPIRGAAPDLTLIKEWAGRLWGVDRADMDNLRWTEAGTMFAWGALNTLPIPHIGEDSYGITALIPRRNALGVGRKKGLQQITGSTLANIKPTTLQEECGVESQESVVVYQDRAFFLWRDGVYCWDDNGVNCVSDEKVRSWFATDDVFNRAMFQRAFAVLDEADGMYLLFLASAGSNVIDRWVAYDISQQSWWGPHKTDAFDPSSAFLVRGSNGYPFHMIGSRQGFLSLNVAAKNDWGVHPIAMRTVGKPHDALEPDFEKVWGECSILGKVQPSGIITITPAVGDFDTIVDTASIAYDMTTGRQNIGRIGFGALAQLTFEHATLNEDVLIYGYELPFIVTGRR